MSQKALDEALKNLLEKLIEKYRPVFGRKEDIFIAQNLKKLKLKSLTVDQRNSIMSKIIYKLKELGYGDKNS